MNEPLNFNPSLPPLLSGHPVLPPLDPFKAAVAAAGSGEGEAGDLFWSCDTEAIAFAIVLEPDVQRSRVQEMLFVLMVSAADALGAICPPEMGISWNWPVAINANRARLGTAQMIVSDGDDENGAPDWMVVGLEIGLKPTSDAEPGEDVAATTLWDEGGVEVEAVPALESLARHFLTWVHRWESDGFKPVHEAWLFRCDGYRKTVSILDGETPVIGNFMGLDNYGNLLLKVGEDARVFEAVDHLSSAGCAQPVVGQNDKHAG